MVLSWVKILKKGFIVSNSFLVKSTVKVQYIPILPYVCFLIKLKSEIVILGTYFIQTSTLSYAIHLNLCWE